MNKKLEEKLLETNTLKGFFEIVETELPEMYDSRDLWTENLVEKAIKLLNITREEFEAPFNIEILTDYIEDMR